MAAKRPQFTKWSTGGANFEFEEDGEQNGYPVYKLCFDEGYKELTQARNSCSRLVSPNSKRNTGRQSMTYTALSALMTQSATAGWMSVSM